MQMKCEKCSTIYDTGKNSFTVECWTCKETLVAPLKPGFKYVQKECQGVTVLNMFPDTTEKVTCKKCDKNFIIGDEIVYQKCGQDFYNVEWCTEDLGDRKEDAERVIEEPVAEKKETEKENDFTSPDGSRCVKCYNCASNVTIPKNKWCATCNSCNHFNITPIEHRFKYVVIQCNNRILCDRVVDQTSWILCFACKAKHRIGAKLAEKYCGQDIYSTETYMSIIKRIEEENKKLKEEKEKAEEKAKNVGVLEDELKKLVEGAKEDLKKKMTEILDCPKKDTVDKEATEISEKNTQNTPPVQAAPLPTYTLKCSECATQDVIPMTWSGVYCKSCTAVNLVPLQPGFKYIALTCQGRHLYERCFANVCRFVCVCGENHKIYDDVAKEIHGQKVYRTESYSNILTKLEAKLEYTQYCQNSEQNVKNADDEQISQLKKENAALKVENENQKKEIEALKKGQEYSKGICDDYYTTVTEMTKQTNTLKNELETSKKLIQEITKASENDLANKDNYIQDCEDRLSAFTAKLAINNAKMNEDKLDLDKKEAEIAEMKNELQKMKLVNDQLTQANLLAMNKIGERNSTNGSSEKDAVAKEPSLDARCSTDIENEPSSDYQIGEIEDSLSAPSKRNSCTIEDPMHFSYKSPTDLFGETEDLFLNTDREFMSIEDALLARDI